MTSVTAAGGIRERPYCWLAYFDNRLQRGRNEQKKGKPAEPPPPDGQGGAASVYLQESLEADQERRDCRFTNSTIVGANCEMTQQKEGGGSAKPTLPDVDTGSASDRLEEIHEAIAKARAHAAQWLTHRENMAKVVAEYEALTPVRNPSARGILAVPIPPGEK